MVLEKYKAVGLFFVALMFCKGFSDDIPADNNWAGNDVVAAGNAGHSRDGEHKARADQAGGQDYFLNIEMPGNRYSLCKDYGNHKSSSPEQGADVFANKYR